MIPIMGFAQLSLFGGYAIYFPELFPTRLRSTGTSFCYNIGRYAVAAGVLFQGVLTTQLAVLGGGDQTLRSATPASSCAACSCWAWSRCRSPRRRKAGRCRSKRRGLCP